jgi:peptidoglycan/LPS O-acetylase OafA/YrhL
VADPALAPPPGNPAFETLSGLRGVLALAVLTCHGTAVAWSNGWWGSLAFAVGHGIHVFFALSGFLLYRPYVRARALGRSAPRLRAFARRRFLRILPAYWIALTLLAIWPGVDGVFTEDWWVYYGLLQIYRVEWLAGGGLPQVWSLCIEVSFYLLLPVYAWLVARRRPRRGWLRAELWPALGLLAVGLGIRMAGSAELLPGRTFGMLPGFLYLFALGMVLAVVSVAAHNGDLPARAEAFLRRAVGPALVAAVAILLLRTSLYPPPDDPRQFALPLIGADSGPVGGPVGELLKQLSLLVMVTCVLLSAVSVSAGSLAHRLFGRRELIAVAAVSYALYLWHVPLLGEWAKYAARNQIDFFGHPVVATLVGGLCVSLPVAILAHRWFELPFLRLKERADGRGRSQPGAWRKTSTGSPGGEAPNRASVAASSVTGAGPR